MFVINKQLDTISPNGTQGMAPSKFQQKKSKITNKCVQVCTSVYKCVQVCASVYKCEY